MQGFTYHQTSDGIHVIDLQDDRSIDFSVEDITGMLKQIQQDTDGAPAYVLLNLEAQYHLPLRQFVQELRRFVTKDDKHDLKIALVVQPAMINLLEVMVKTLVATDFINYFTMSARAYLWLNLQHKRNAAQVFPG